MYCADTMAHCVGDSNAEIGMCQHSEPVWSLKVVLRENAVS